MPTSPSPPAHPNRPPHRLARLAPPPPPPDLTPAARLVALGSISPSAHGMKLRVIGQILWFDTANALAILTASGHPDRPTLAVNLAVPLLSVPYTTEQYMYPTGAASSGSTPAAPASRPPTGLVNRRRVRLAPGEWVCVVGWLEGEPPGQWRMPPGFADPPAKVLDAIYMSMAREPPVVPYSAGQALPVT
ncbi:hypothetical protein Q5752_006774 [Cryptotrichosporon argae]